MGVHHIYVTKLKDFRHKIVKVFFLREKRDFIVLGSGWHAIGRLHMERHVENAFM